MIPHRKQAQALLTRKGRRQQNRTIIEGVRIVEEAIASEIGITTLFHIAPEPDTRLETLINTAFEAGFVCAEVESEELLTLSDTQSPQGVVAAVELPEWDTDEFWAGTGDVVILDNVRDPGNAGTLMRTALAAGARGMISMRGTVEMANPKVVRASMGAFFRLPLITAVNPEEVAQTCREHGLPVVATVMDGNTSPNELLAHDAVALVLGGEADGIDRAWHAPADMRVRIPQTDLVESLNVASAGSVLLFRSVWKG
jgi:RNA methyltransferase, TrmH family